MTGESLTPLNDQLVNLKSVEEQAGERLNAATAALKNSWTINRDLLSPWVGSLRQNEEASAEQLQEWTSNLLAQVSERGLVFSLDPLQTGHNALVVTDPAIQAEVAAADQAAAAARASRIQFENQFSSSMKAERDYEKAKNFQAALEKGESLEEIREALAT